MPGVAGASGPAGVNPQGAPQPPTIGGIGAGPGGAAAAAAGTRKPNLSALQEIEEKYNKRLDDDISQLMESFGDIVKVASVRRKQARSCLYQ